MSDALTDIACDQRRGRLYGSYLEALKAFLTNSTAENRSEVIKMAKETDSIRGGYWGGQSSLSENIEEIISKLQEGDKDTWAKFLFSLKDLHDFRKFKLFSPFADKLLIAVDYGCGFVSFHGELEPFIASLIHSDRSWKTYDADDYIIALDEPNTEDVEVFWVSCGIGGVSGPREVEK